MARSQIAGLLSINHAAQGTISASAAAVAVAVVTLLMDDGIITNHWPPGASHEIKKNARQFSIISSLKYMHSRHDSLPRIY